MFSQFYWGHLIPHGPMCLRPGFEGGVGVRIRGLMKENIGEWERDEKGNGRIWRKKVWGRRRESHVLGRAFEFWIFHPIIYLFFVLIFSIFDEYIMYTSIRENKNTKISEQIEKSIFSLFLFSFLANLYY